MVRGLVSVDTDAGWTPLYLSTIAGMSTCLGALIVFCHPIDDEDDPDEEQRVGLTEEGNGGGIPRSPRRRMSGKRKVSPSTMAFSLALAGSVMVTVSVVSIGPECLAASSMPQNASHDNEVNSFFVFGITLMPILSLTFLHRLLSFGAGCLLYFLMSKAFPEPEETLSIHLEGGQRSPRPRLSDDKLSDDEHDIQSPNNGGKSPPAKQFTAKGTATNTNGDGPLQRRGTGMDGIEEATTSSTTGGKKGVSRRPPTERYHCCGGRFASCISSLRTFTKGSDLATSEARRANRVAMLLFFSLLIHNFPEGLAVAASALESDQLGMTVTIGIMIHNIPEVSDGPFFCSLSHCLDGNHNMASLFSPI